MGSLPGIHHRSSRNIHLRRSPWALSNLRTNNEGLFRSSSPPTIPESKSASDVRCAISTTRHGETKCEAIVLHSKTSTQRAVLENTDVHRLAEASAHDKAGGISKNVSTASCCGFDLLGHALDRAREILCQSTPGDPKPGDFIYGF